MGAYTYRRGPRYARLAMPLMTDYRKTTSGDIVSMLLNIYDTKEVFVKELQVILAEKLLSSKDYSAEKEVSTQLMALTTASKCRINQATFRRGEHPTMRCHAQRYHRVKTCRSRNP